MGTDWVPGKAKIGPWTVEINPFCPLNGRLASAEEGPEEKGEEKEFDTRRESDECYGKRKSQSGASESVFIRLFGEFFNRIRAPDKIVPEFPGVLESPCHI